MANKGFTIKFNQRDIRAFKKAIKRNPTIVKMYSYDFMTEAMAILNRLIIRNPWQIGGTGGGAPKDEGNLRDTHIREIRPLEAVIYPTAKYAEYVHEGTSKMQARPWLEYAKDKGEKDIYRKADELLKKVVNKLAK